MVWTCARVSETRILKQVTNWKSPGRRKPGKVRRRWQENTKQCKKGTWEMKCGKTGGNGKLAQEEA